MKSQLELALHNLLTLGFDLPRVRSVLPKLAGLSHQDLARAAGVSRVIITQTLQGTRKNPEIREAICKSLQVPCDALFG